MVVYPYSWTHPHLQWTFTVPLPQPCHARHFALSPQCSSTRLARSHPPSPAAEVQVVHSYGWNMLEPFILSDTVLDTVFHCHNHNWFSLIDPNYISLHTVFQCIPHILGLDNYHPHPDMFPRIIDPDVLGDMPPLASGSTKRCFEDQWSYGKSPFLICKSPISMGRCQ